MKHGKVVKVNMSRAWCWFVSIIVLSTVMCFAGNSGRVKTYRGRITDQKGLPVANAAIEAADLYAGITSNEKGFFTITLNPDTVHQLFFHQRGYGQANVLLDTVTTDSLHITLEKLPNVLNEVTVSRKRRKQRESYLGRHKLTTDGSAYMDWDDEVAIYLDQKRRRHNGYLKEVYVYVTDEGTPGDSFRLQVYDEDTATELPLHALIADTVLIHGTTGNEWIKTDVSKYHIPTKNGVFVSVKWWCTGDRNVRVPLKKRAQQWMGKSDIDEGMLTGPTMGMTFKYGILSLTYQKPGEGKYADRWIYSDPRQSGYKVHRWINPMIYCTYNY